MQASRRQVNESNLAVGATVTVKLAVPLIPREEVNFHNIWCSVSAEPQNADANSQGTWVLYIKRENFADVGWTDTVFNDETNNAIIVACGAYSASNQTPYNLPPTQIKTSRTLQAGDTLSLASTATGVTAGLISTRVMLCAHVTRK